MSFYIRSSLDFEPDAKGSNPLVLDALSPDLIPIGIKNLTSDALTTASSYSHYVSNGFQYNYNNHVYVRAKAEWFGKDVKEITAKVSLRKIKNELILWPQNWKGTEHIVGSAIGLKSSKDDEVVVGSGPISFYIPDTEKKDGRHPVLIGTTYVDNETVYADAPNWRDFVDTIGNDTSISTYNAIHFNPDTAKGDPWPVVLKTVLEIKENTADKQKLTVGLYGVLTGTDTPPYGSFTVVDNAGKEVLTLAKTRLTELTQFEKSHEFEPDFKGFVEIKIERDDGDALVSDMASISLYIVGSKTSEKDEDGKVKTQDFKIGTESVIFDHHAHDYPTTYKASPFYFRGKKGDTEDFPRDAIPDDSLDIQPWGLSPDYNAAKQLLDDFDEDKSKATGKNWYNTGGNNYVYLRGTFTEPATGQMRLFAVPQNMTHSLGDINPDGQTTYQAIRFHNPPENDIPDLRKVTAAAKGPFVAPGAFEILNFTGTDKTSYDLVAEFRPTTDKAPEPQWPSETFAAALTAGQTWDSWVKNQPALTIRSIPNFIPDPDASTWQLLTSFSIDSAKYKYTKTTMFAIKVVLNKVPVPSSVAMDVNLTAGVLTEKNKNTGHNIKLPKTKVTDGDMTIGIQFTGVDPNQVMSFNVDIKWFKGDGADSLPDGASITAELHYTTAKIPQDKPAADDKADDKVNDKDDDNDDKDDKVDDDKVQVPNARRKLNEHIKQTFVVPGGHPNVENLFHHLRGAPPLKAGAKKQLPFIRGVAPRVKQEGLHNHDEGSAGMYDYKLAQSVSKYDKDVAEVMKKNGISS